MLVRAQAFHYKMTKPSGCNVHMVTVVNNTVLCTRNLLREKILCIFITDKSKTVDVLINLFVVIISQYTDLDVKSLHWVL